MPSRADMTVWALFLLAGIAIGIAIGYFIWGRQTVVVVEKPAEPEWHDDGSLTAMRDPKAKPRNPAPTKPKGSTTRVVEVDVLPDPVNLPERKVGGVTCPPERVACPSVSVRLDTTQLEDGTHRVSVIAHGGEVLDAIDIPVGETVVVGKRPWAVGYERTPEGANALAVERDVGRLRFGGTMTVQDHPSVGLRVLMKF